MRIDFDLRKPCCELKVDFQGSPPMVKVKELAKTPLLRSSLCLCVTSFACFIAKSHKGSAALHGPSVVNPLNNIETNQTHLWKTHKPKLCLWSNRLGADCWPTQYSSSRWQCSSAEMQWYLQIPSMFSVLYVYWLSSTQTNVFLFFLLLMPSQTLHNPCMNRLHAHPLIWHRI